MQLPDELMAAIKRLPCWTGNQELQDLDAIELIVRDCAWVCERLVIKRRAKDHRDPEDKLFFEFCDAAAKAILARYEIDSSTGEIAGEETQAVTKGTPSDEPSRAAAKDRLIPFVIQVHGTRFGVGCKLSTVLDCIERCFGYFDQPTATQVSDAGPDTEGPRCPKCGVVKDWCICVACGDDKAMATGPDAKQFPPCKGTNCGATDGISHSRECFAEHEATVNPGGIYGKPDAKQESDTPRTDVALRSIFREITDLATIKTPTADLCRQLERELAAANAAHAETIRVANEEMDRHKAELAAANARIAEIDEEIKTADDWKLSYEAERKAHEADYLELNKLVIMYQAERKAWKEAVSEAVKEASCCAEALTRAETAERTVADLLKSRKHVEELLSTAEQRAEALQWKVERLRKALQPFAAGAEESRDNWRKDSGEMRECGVPEDADAAVTFTQGQLDAADAALKGEKQP